MLVGSERKRTISVDYVMSGGIDRIVVIVVVVVTVVAVVVVSFVDFEIVVSPCIVAALYRVVDLQNVVLHIDLCVAAALCIGALFVALVLFAVLVLFVVAVLYRKSQRYDSGGRH